MKLRFTIILTVSMGIFTSCSDGDMELDERTVTAIGEDGGIAQSAAGKMSLEFEAGALSGTQEIVIETLRNTDVPQAVSPVYALGPDGMTFGDEVLMTVEVDGALNENVSVAIARIDGNRAEILADSVWNALDGLVSANLTQLGNYAAVTVEQPCETQDELAIQAVSEYNPSAPMAGIQVQVNDAEWVTTNARGYACFPGVSGTYTVRLYQSIQGLITGVRSDDIWVLIERSANPLVVPVDDGTTPREAEITGQVTGLSGQGTPWFQASFGEVIEGSVGANGNLGLQYSWQGPTPQASTLHVLETDGGNLPTQFFGYGSTSMTVNAPQIGEPGSPGMVSGVNVSMTSVNASSASGSVNLPSVFNGADRSVSLSVNLGNTDLFVGFEDNPDWSMPFGYTLPEIPGGRARLSFSTVPTDTPVIGFLSRNGPWASQTLEVDLPASNLTVDIPEPASLVSPLADATVTATASFSWTPASTTDRHALTARCVGVDSNGEFTIHYRTVESVGTQVSLPSIPGLELPSGTICEWSIDSRSPGFSANSGSQGITIQ